jgi:signal transduction histidine kinase
MWMRAHPMVGDSLIALLLLLCDIAVLTVLRAAEDPTAKPWFVALPIDLAAVLPLVFRRRYPVTVAYLVLFLGMLHAGLELGLGGAIANAISVYTLVVYAGRKQGVVYLVVTAVATTLQLLIQFRDEWLVNTIVSVLVIAFCWVLGEFVGARRAYQSELEARLRLLETERDQASRIAVAQERGRIARELHDVVAHAVSVMVVQADGATYALRNDPDLAERAVRTVSETGRGALAELRRLLDVLRNEEAADEPRVPQPSAAALGELADRIREAGLLVELDVEGELTDLPAGVSLGVYRIVQESLTNALKHAGSGTAARVCVRRLDDVVEVEVSDDAGGRAHELIPAGEQGPVLLGGNGLIGMRERAHVLGGTLQVGPLPGGGWLVHARLPMRTCP